jgi:hypothetical protein
MFNMRVSAGDKDADQVMLRRDAGRVYYRHGLSPDFGKHVRAVKIVNSCYYQCQLAHGGLLMFALRRYDNINDTPMSRFLSSARPIGLAR